MGAAEAAEDEKDRRGRKSRERARPECALIAHDIYSTMGCVSQEWPDS